MRCLTDDERELVERHLPLVHQVVGRVAAHYPRHADREELTQAARLGLVEAALRFDPARGVPFGSWAMLRVRGAILDAVRALDFAPRALRSAERHVLAAREELLCRLGRLATDDEVAAHLGTTPQRLTRIDGRVHGSVILSLDATYGGEGGAPVTLATALVDVHLQPLEALEERERAHYVRDALACLPARMQEVVLASYVDGEPLSDIARRLGVTDSRVSQLRAEALMLVREAIAVLYGESRPVPSGHSGRRRAAYAAEVAERSTFEHRLTGLVPLQRVG
ncbi:MAG: polymerase, sigma 28 subunit, SigD/FliA/WhiG [Frankiales bacterium]|nr:polymerase, sigma 28 subunit, SigD/FliA/WhiG [Frankiales bacterium]